MQTYHCQTPTPIKSKTDHMWLPKRLLAAFIHILSNAYLRPVNIQKRKHYTEEEKKELMKLKAEGKTNAEVATSIKRTYNSVRNMYNELKNDPRYKVSLSESEEVQISKAGNIASTTPNLRDT